MAFAKNIVQDITIYPRYISPLIATSMTNFRIVLHGVFAEEDSILITQRTGVVVATTTAFYIPIEAKQTGREYIDPGKWKLLSEEDARERYWTIDPVQSPATILMTKGVLDYEFTWGTVAQISTAETALLNANPSMVRQKLLNVNTFGSKNMQNVTVRASR